MVLVSLYDYGAGDLKQTSHAFCTLLFVCVCVCVWGGGGQVCGWGLGLRVLTLRVYRVRSVLEALGLQTYDFAFWDQGFFKS